MNAFPAGKRHVSMTQLTSFMTSLEQLIRSDVVGVRNNNTQQIRHKKINRIRTWCCHISKISNSVGRNDNFLAKARKLSILPTSLDICDIRQHYLRIIYLFNTSNLYSVETVF